MPCLIRQRRFGIVCTQKKGRNPLIDNLFTGNDQLKTNTVLRMRGWILRRYEPEQFRRSLYLIN